MRDVLANSLCIEQTRHRNTETSAFTWCCVLWPPSESKSNIHSTFSSVSDLYHLLREINTKYFAMLSILRAVRLNQNNAVMTPKIKTMCREKLKTFRTQLRRTVGSDNNS